LQVSLIRVLMHELGLSTGAAKFLHGQRLWTGGHANSPAPASVVCAGTRALGVASGSKRKCAWAVTLLGSTRYETPLFRGVFRMALQAESGRGSAVQARPACGRVSARPATCGIRAVVTSATVLAW